MSEMHHCTCENCMRIMALKESKRHQSGAFCPYCGCDYPGIISPEEIERHVLVCQKHPLRKARDEIKRLSGMLQDVIGATNITTEKEASPIKLEENMPVYEDTKSMVKSILEDFTPAKKQPPACSFCGSPYSTHHLDDPDITACDGPICREKFENKIESILKSATEAMIRHIAFYRKLLDERS